MAANKHGSTPQNAPAAERETLERRSTRGSLPGVSLVSVRVHGLVQMTPVFHRSSPLGQDLWKTGVICTSPNASLTGRDVVLSKYNVSRLPPGDLRVPAAQSSARPSYLRLGRLERRRRAVVLLLLFECWRPRRCGEGCGVPLLERAVVARHVRSSPHFAPGLLVGFGPRRRAQQAEAVAGQRVLVIWRC